ncbi:cell division protein ZapA [Pseudomonas sp. 2FE]|uniref:cell division protein ZapA n=1 Tax=Pseudomonas sp. 2FE TaxID=2502190 RepID=UPI0010F72817
MSGEGETVTVVSILGRDYSIKAPAGQAPALLASAQLLKGLLAETKAKSPALLGDKLLVMTALQLCAQHLELQQQHQRDIQGLEAYVGARLADIASLIRQA